MELALWSFHFAKKLQPELLNESCEPTEPKTRGKKRTNKDTGDKNSTDSEGDQNSPPLTKKRKQ